MEEAQQNIDLEKRKLLKKLADFKVMELLNIILVILIISYLLLIVLGFREYAFNKTLELSLAIFFTLSLILVHIIRFKTSKKYLKKYHEKTIKSKFWIVFIIIFVLFIGGAIIGKGFSSLDLEFFTEGLVISAILGVLYNKISENL